MRRVMYLELALGCLILLFALLVFEAPTWLD